MIQYDKYDLLLEALGYKSLTAPIPEIYMEENLELIIELSDELGVSLETESHNLILWNDDVNDMMHVTLALYEICKLDNEDSMRVMLEAHNKGKSIARSGSIDELLLMASGLRERNINATIQTLQSDL